MVSQSFPEWFTQLESSLSDSEEWERTGDEFYELRALLEKLPDLIKDAIDILEQGHGMEVLASELSGAWSADASSQLVERVRVLSSQAIADVSDTKNREQLFLHGLDSASLEWRLKFETVKSDLRRLYELQRTASGGFTQWKRASLWMETALGAVNNILGSVALLPSGAASAIQEIKHLIEHWHSRRRRG